MKVGNYVVLAVTRANQPLSQFSSRTIDIVTGISTADICISGTTGEDGTVLGHEMTDSFRKYLVCI